MLPKTINNSNNILLISAIFYPGESGQIVLNTHNITTKEQGNFGILLFKKIEHTFVHSKKYEEFIIGFLHPFEYLLNIECKFVD